MFHLIPLNVSFSYYSFEEFFICYGRSHIFPIKLKKTGKIPLDIASNYVDETNIWGKSVLLSFRGELKPSF